MSSEHDSNPPAIKTLVDQASTSAEFLNALFNRAHTTRAFTAEPVPVELIKEAYETLRWAPTAFNAQPIRLDVFASREARQRLVPMMSSGNAAVVAEAPLTIVVSADEDLHKSVGAIGAPAGVVDLLAGNEALRKAQAHNSAWLQLGYFITVLRAKGLDVSVMAGARMDQIDAAFHADNAWKAIAVVNVGYSAGAGATRPREGRHSFEDIAVVR